MERLEAWIHGTVQGVFYRASARAEAQRLGLAGAVRNHPDGSVELVAEGPRPALDSLLAWAREGPPGAEVERVVFAFQAPTGDLDGFQIVR